MSYQELSGKIPLYLAGGMNAKECAELEAFAGEHVEFQKEIDELLPTFEALDRDFEAASRTTFQLSAARRAELRGATHVNVLCFPAKGGRSGVKTGATSWRAPGRVSGWIALAGALIMGIYLSLDSMRPRTIAGMPPSQLIAADAEPLDAGPGQLPASTYVYRGDYGLGESYVNNPDIWSLPERGQPLELAQAASDGRQEMFRPEPQWDPAYAGLDGSRPYYRFPSLRVRGAI